MITKGKNEEILQILNEQPRTEEAGNLFPYALVRITSSLLEKLSAFGIEEDDLTKHGDEKEFCIISFAFEKELANEYKDKKLLFEKDKYAVFNKNTNETFVFDFLQYAKEKYDELTEKDKSAKIIIFESLQL